ncbi:MAG: hypothetical protein C0478_05720 [Planctomyces sp.]|nr:hypothetical protein [Planctomyces sp.]
MNVERVKASSPMAWSRLGMVLLAGLALPPITGCAEGRLTSRWAMDHQDYAQKYDRPYEERGARKLGRMAKQASDARFLDDDTGVTVEAMGAGDPLYLGGQVGVNHYFTPMISGRAGLFGAASEEHLEGFLVGLDTSVRLNAPSRFSPFVGVGAMVGTTYEKIEVNESLMVSTGSDRQTRRETSSMAALYPEVGATFWINGHTSIQGFGRYLISTDNHSQTWMCGVGMTFMMSPRVDEIGNAGRSFPPPGKAETTSEPSPRRAPYEFFIPVDEVGRLYDDVLEGLQDRHVIPQPDTRAPEPWEPGLGDPKLLPPPDTP